MNSNQSYSQKREIPFGGILLILAGLFMLMGQFIQFEIAGGVFLAVLGLFFILWGATKRQAGLLVPGGILSGLSLGVILVEDVELISAQYSDAIILISIGLGFALITLLTQVFTKSKYWWALIVGGILSAVGSILLISTLPGAESLTDLLVIAGRVLNYLWPIFMVGLGIKIIISQRAAADN